jgi:Gluconate 2-dehydrogenase subunit 3
LTTLSALRALLSPVLDTLVPPSGEFPGAAAVALDHVLTVAGASPALDALLSRGLQTIEDDARIAGGFARLDADARERILQTVESSHPEFFEALVRHVYDGYYAHPTIVERLGLDPTPVHPRGHRVDVTELPDLSRVAARGPLYRRA